MKCCATAIKVRLIPLLMLLVVIPSGLISRSYGNCLPEIIAVYAGDTLWAAAVLLTLRILFPVTGLLKSVVAALLISFAVEFSQLYQSPWLNQLRATLPGRLLLGSGFLWSDLVCYSTGVALTVVALVIINDSHLIKKLYAKIINTRAITITVFVIYMMIFLWLTIGYRLLDGRIRTKVIFVPFQTISSLFLYPHNCNLREFMVNIIGNIVVMIPFGLLLPLLCPKQCNRWWKIAGITFLFILFIELMQHFLQAGHFDVDDITLNIIGALFGYGLVKRSMK